MGVKLGTMWYLSGSVNELDRKGIKKDTDSGNKNIPKVTVSEILKYGQDNLEKMQ